MATEHLIGSERDEPRGYPYRPGAWQQFGMVTYDPDERLHPVRTSLLNLVGVRAEESCLLDEHFRCLPPIIDFSNRRWYGEQLRIMTDVHHKRFGSPDQPVIELHHVEEGTISGCQKGQENEIEAKVPRRAPGTHR